VLLVQFDDIPRVEYRLSGEQEIADGPDSTELGSGVDNMRAPNGLGGQVKWRSGKCVGGRRIR
jgi:hypothetical protein